MAKTAKVIKLEGNPNKPESAEHIIEFPGGSISVCRTSKNEYWAHIEVNQRGMVVGGRMDYDNPPGDVRTIDDLDELHHIAVRLKTSD